MSTPATATPSSPPASGTCTSELDEALDQWLLQGCRGIGQISIRRSGGEGFQLCHQNDLARLDQEGIQPAGLQLHQRAEDARQLALHDDEGQYRPLKTAPNLRHGWVLEIDGVRELRLALDHFYPAAVGLWLRHQQDRLQPVSLRQALQRQTGMYRFSGNISHEGAVDMVRDYCRHGSCLRKVTWTIEPDQGNPALEAEDTDPLLPPWGLESGRIPLLCIEVCSHLIGASRKIARAEFNAAQGKPTPGDDDHHHGHGHGHGHSHD